MKEEFVERVPKPAPNAAVVEEPLVTPKKIRPRQATALGHALLESVAEALGGDATSRRLARGIYAGAATRLKLNRRQRNRILPGSARFAKTVGRKRGSGVRLGDAEMRDAMAAGFCLGGISLLLFSFFLYYY